MSQHPQHLTLTTSEQRDAAAGKLVVWRKMRRQPPEGYCFPVACELPYGAWNWLRVEGQYHKGWWSGPVCPLRVGSPVQLRGRSSGKEKDFRLRKIYGTPTLISAVPELREGKGWGWVFTFEKGT